MTVPGIGLADVDARATPRRPVVAPALPWVATAAWLALDALTASGSHAGWLHARLRQSAASSPWRIAKRLAPARLEVPILL